MTKRQLKRRFILDTLLPYKEDPKTTAWDHVSSICEYLTNDGKKCAVGKHLIEGEHQHFAGDVIDLDETYNLEDILTKEAKEIGLTMSEWRAMQGYHDAIALYKYDEKPITKINLSLERLEKATGLEFPELEF